MVMGLAPSHAHRSSYTGIAYGMTLPMFHVEHALIQPITDEKEKKVAMAQQQWTTQDIVAHAMEDLNLNDLLPKHAEIYNYPLEPITPEKVLLCLLSLGDWAMEEAEKAEKEEKKSTDLHTAALSFKYAYMLRNQGISPDLEASQQATPSQQVNERLVEIIANRTQIEKQHITREVSLDDLGLVGLSGALDFIFIITDMQEQFHLSIPDQAAEKWKTIADIQDYRNSREYRDDSSDQKEKRFKTPGGVESNQGITRNMA